jgi:hypothetical protein
LRTALLNLALVILGVFYHHHAVTEATARGDERGYKRGLDHGYAKGHRIGSQDALSVTPPSERLELICARLWMEDIDQAWEKKGLR